VPNPHYFYGYVPGSVHPFLERELTISVGLCVCLAAFDI